MKAREALTVDEIFREMEGYDLVLTVNPSLADALNVRLEEAKLDHFATTPRQLARDSCSVEPSSKREVFYRLINENDLSWKENLFYLENILDCWEQTGNPKKITDYPRFKNDKVRKTLEIITSNTGKPNIYQAVGECSIDQGKVAAVCPYQFTELDKTLLPPDYDQKQVLTSNITNLPEFNIFDSEAGIVEFLGSNINRERVDQYALVLNPESGYQPMVESLLEAKDIPYMSKENLSEQRSVKRFMAICRLLVESGNRKIKKIRPLLRYLDLNVSRAMDEQYVSEIDIEGMEKLKSLLGKMKSETLGGIVQEYEKNAGSLEEEFKIGLKKLGLLDKRVGDQSLDLLQLYLDSFHIETSRASDHGVLLINPKTSSFIDREIVFHLGMDSSWRREFAGKPWSQRSQHEKASLKDFQILLQSGTSYYLVQEKVANEKVTPCFYLNEFSNRDVTSFTDLPHRRVRSSSSEGLGNGFDREEINPRATDRTETFSQTNLNIFVRSPREYFFSRVIEDIKRDYLKKGTLFHDFAEFYLSHPDFVDEKGLKEFSEITSERLRPFLDELEIETERTEFLIGLENIKKFLREEEPESASYPGYAKKHPDNFFADYFDMQIEHKSTEMWFEDKDLGGKGKVDLILSPDCIIDYKSSKYKDSARRIVKHSNVDLLKDNPQFQAIMYLSFHRKQYPDRKLSIVFYHFLENVDELAAGRDSSYRDNMVKVFYYPRPFREQVPRKETFEKLKESSKRNEKFLSKFSYQCYRDFFSNNRITHEYDKEKLLESELSKKLLAEGEEQVGNHKYVRKSVKSVLKKLVEIRRGNYFKEDLDKFEDFLETQLEKLQEYEKDRFPPGDADFEDLQYPDLMIR